MIYIDEFRNDFEGRLALRQAEPILEAGFSFSNIKIDGFHFQRNLNGSVEEWDPQEDLFFDGDPDGI